MSRSENEEFAGSPASANGFDSKRGDKKKVNRQIRDFIGEKVKASFDSVVNEPVPDRFIDLIKSLDVRKPNSS